MERHSLDWIVSAKTKEESEKRYDEWASTYDGDLLGDWQYKLPVFIGDLFMKYVNNPRARILDVGAGTGLGAEYIYGQGYQDIHGIDMSRGMLREAERKGIYRKLDRMVLGEKLAFSDDVFDAAISVGTIGTAPPESFNEIVRAVKSGGYIVFSLMKSYYEKDGFDMKIQSLENARKWELVERVGPMLGLPGESAESFYYGFVFRVL